MHLRHEPDGGVDSASVDDGASVDGDSDDHADGDDADSETVHTLASDVDVAESFLAQARGLMFRRSIPDGYALVFDFTDVDTRDVHMVFVPFDVDAVWVEDEEVQRVERLSAWTGRGEARCDALVELPAGAADGVSVGDRVWIVD